MKSAETQQNASQELNILAPINTLGCFFLRYIGRK